MPWSVDVLTNNDGGAMILVNFYFCHSVLKVALAAYPFGSDALLDPSHDPGDVQSGVSFGVSFSLSLSHSHTHTQLHFCTQFLRGVCERSRQQAV